MKVIIAGGRHTTDYNLVLNAIEHAGFNITTVVSGCAKGVDTLGEQFAKECNLPIDKFPADWDKHGKSAGYIRNKQMAENADALIAVWDGISPGTKNMINIATKLNLKVYIERI